MRRTIRIGKLPDNEFSCLVILKKAKKGMKTAELGKRTILEWCRYSGEVYILKQEIIGKP